MFHKPSSDNKDAFSTHPANLGRKPELSDTAFSTHPAFIGVKQSGVQSYGAPPDTQSTAPQPAQPKPPLEK